MDAKLIFPAIAMVLALGCAWKRTPVEPQNQKRILLFNAQIDSKPNSDAVLVVDNKITQIGVYGQLIDLCEEPCTRIDLKSHYLLAGFHDNHIHTTDMAEFDQYLKLKSAEPLAIQREINDFASQTPNSAWIFARGWTLADAQKFHYHAKLLDAAVADRPVFLRDQSGHHAWVNSKALELAKIDRNTNDPSGGEIVRDLSGNPTGILKENAVYLLSKALPFKTVRDFEQLILESQEKTLKFGLSSVNSARFLLSQNLMDAYLNLIRTKKIKQRIFVWGTLDGTEAEFQRQLTFARSLSQDGLVRFSVFKTFVDGDLEGQTAAMFSHYRNSKSKGQLLFSQERLNELVLRANRAGYPVALHAVGDLAVHSALNAIEHSQHILGKKFFNRVEHVSLVRNSDLPRFKELGVVASLQPNLVLYKSKNSELRKSLGDERLRQLFPMGDLSKSGAILTLGSDFPYSLWPTPDPIANINMATSDAIDTQNLSQNNQRISVAEAIAAYTKTSAMVEAAGDWLGQIEPGYVADLVVLSQNPHGANSKDWSNIQILMTLVNGEIVYRHP